MQDFFHQQWGSKSLWVENWITPLQVPNIITSNLFQGSIFQVSWLIWIMVTTSKNDISILRLFSKVYYGVLMIQTYQASGGRLGLFAATNHSVHCVTCFFAPTSQNNHQPSTIHRVIHFPCPSHKSQGAAISRGRSVSRWFWIGWATAAKVACTNRYFFGKNNHVIKWMICMYIYIYIWI